MTTRDRDLAVSRRLVEGAERIIVSTGAGISAESGVPTFRGPDGLWRRFRPEDLATPEAFARDPRLVWEWYAWRRELISECRPNAAHHALAALALARPGVRILTQNVDGLHAVAAREAAGDRDPGPALSLELHGSIFRVRCTVCGDAYEHRDRIDVGAGAALPACRRCGGLLRPGVVWFGEALDPVVLDEAYAEASRADLCLVVGTSGMVQPAAGLPLIVRQNGGKVIEVNPEATPLTGAAEVSIRARAAEVLPGLLGIDRLSD